MFNNHLSNSTTHHDPEIESPDYLIREVNIHQVTHATPHPERGVLDRNALKDNEIHKSKDFLDKLSHRPESVEQIPEESPLLITKTPHPSKGVLERGNHDALDQFTKNEGDNHVVVEKLPDKCHDYEESNHKHVKGTPHPNKGFIPRGGEKKDSLLAKGKQLVDQILHPESKAPSNVSQAETGHAKASSLHKIMDEIKSFTDVKKSDMTTLTEGIQHLAQDTNLEHQSNTETDDKNDEIYGQPDGEKHVTFETTEEVHIYKQNKPVA